MLGLALLPLAAFLYLQALTTRFALVWAEANPYAGELPPEQPAKRYLPRPAHGAVDDWPGASHEDAQQTEALRARARLESRLASALVLCALALGIAAEWRARNNVRTWPWRSLLSHALLGWAWRWDAAWDVWAPRLVALAIIFAALDLSSRRPGPPRLLAWSALLLGLACSRPAPRVSGNSSAVTREILQYDGSTERAPAQPPNKGDGSSIKHKN